MQISNEFRKKTEEHDLDYNKTLFFCIVYQMLGDKGLSLITDTHLLSDEEIDKLRIIFFDKDYETNKQVIKKEFIYVPQQSNDVLVELRNKLLDKGFTSQGHPNNRVSGVIQFGNETEEGLNIFMNALQDNIDIDVLVSAIDKYYESTEMPMRLGNYLSKSAIMDYSYELNKRNRRGKKG